MRRATKPYTATACACAAFSLAGLLPPAAFADAPVLRHMTTSARPAAVYGPPGRPEQYDFDFGEIKAWLRASGEWRIQGEIAHRGFTCATYELGLRFGDGSVGCTDVRWLTEIEYATKVTQCNSATRPHAGGGELPALGRDFARITCAERVIRCTGNCK